ncbi:MAG: haloacid dehalogenase-like hydrolase [Fusobacteriaceae bacterium]
MRKIVFFDICETLYNCNTTFRFLEYIYAGNKKYYLLEFFRKNIFYKLLNKIIYKFLNIDITRSIYFLFLKGKTREELNAKALKFYNEILVKEEIKEGMELLQLYKNQGYEIILISASCDFLVEIISKELNVKKYYSSKLKYKKKCLGKLEKDILKTKHLIIKKYYTNREIVLVTDNIQDFNLALVSSFSYILINKNNKKFWERKMKNINNIVRHVS